MNILLLSALFIFGISALVPAIYLTFTSALGFWEVFILGMIATTLSDLLWYVVGRLVPYEKLLSMRLLRKRKNFIKNISKHIHTKKTFLFFASRFVYGMNIPVGILAGTARIPYLIFFGINTVATALWIVVLTAMVYLLYETARAFHVSSENISILITFIFISIVIIWFILKKISDVVRMRLK